MARRPEGHEIGATSCARACWTGRRCPSTPLSSLAFSSAKCSCGYWPKAWRAAASSRPRHTGRRPRGSRLPRRHPAQSAAFPRARARLCLSRLWRLVHAERLERDAGRRRGRPDQGDRANPWRCDHGAKSRRPACARLGAGPGTAVRGLGNRSPAGRDRPLSGRPAVARIRRSGVGRDRAEQADRHYASGRQSAAILRSGQFVRQRSAGAQSMREGRPVPRLMRARSEAIDTRR